EHLADLRYLAARDGDARELSAQEQPACHLVKHALVDPVDGHVVDQRQRRPGRQVHERGEVPAGQTGDGRNKRRLDLGAGQPRAHHPGERDLFALLVHPCRGVTGGPGLRRRRVHGGQISRPWPVSLLGGRQSMTSLVVTLCPMWRRETVISRMRSRRRGAHMANEFWRELKPVAEVFRPGAAPEAYIQDAATLDERWYAPLSPTAG